MKRNISIVIWGGALLALAGCATPSEVLVDSVAGMQPTGSPFTRSLYGGYLDQARLEAAEYDFGSADLWSAKARTAARGTAPAPETVAGWPIPGPFVAELRAAEDRLRRAISAGAAGTLPAETAAAQVGFDCWVEEQSENFQPDDIAACRDAFAAAMQRIEGGAPRATAQQPAPPAGPGPWRILFGFDSAVVPAEAMPVIREVAAAFEKARPAAIAVSGYADRAGPGGYNLALSRRRAEAVKRALVDAGVPADRIRVTEYGESNPAVPTPDNVRRAENRRVEIAFD